MLIRLEKIFYWIKFGKNFKAKEFSDVKWKEIKEESSFIGKGPIDELVLPKYKSESKEFYEYLLARSYDSKISDEKIIIGIDKTWLPDIEWMDRVINQISKIKTRDIEILVGKGDALAERLVSSARISGLDKTKVVLLGDSDEYYNNSYLSLMQNKLREKIFIAVMNGENLKGVSGTGNASYVMIMKWVEGVLKMAFAEDPSIISIPGLEKHLQVS